MKKPIQKKNVSVSELDKLLSETKVFPDYIKDIYRAKLKGGKYSEFFKNRVYQIINQLESVVTNK